MSYNFALFSTKLQNSLQHVAGEVALIRTGRATVQMLDPVKVEAYGTFLKLSEVANVSAPDANMLIIKPWDTSLLTHIEKAVNASGINLQPVVDKDLIRIVVPALTEERRLEMVKLLHQKIEQGKVMLRNVRMDTQREIKNQEGGDDVSEDDIKREMEQMEKIFKDYMEQLEVLEKEKETDLMTV